MYTWEAIDTILAAFDCAEDERCAVVRVPKPAYTSCLCCKLGSCDHTVIVGQNCQKPGKDCPWYEGEAVE